MATSAPTLASAEERARLYKATPRPQIVHVPSFTFAMVDGEGDPNTSAAFADAIQALYSLSYTIKFALKKELGVQERVGPLESLWWNQGSGTFDAEHKAGWSWTLMIAQPDALDAERFERTRAELLRTKGIAALARARLERFEEGTCAQILHVGPYSTEGETIAALHAFIAEQGATFDGRIHRHHEIYLSDPRRTPPERWRTVVRQPIVAG